MSFKIAGSDLAGGGRGAPLPNGIYQVLVEEANVEQRENGTQVTRRYGNIRCRDGTTQVELPDGSMYHIGNRKLFARSWWEHTNAQAAQIGQRELAREAIALGLMQAPAKGAEAEFPFEAPEAYATEITGKELLVKTRLRAKMGKDKKPVKDEEGNVQMEPEVIEWLAL